MRKVAKDSVEQQHFAWIEAQKATICDVAEELGGLILREEIETIYSSYDDGKTLIASFKTLLALEKDFPQITGYILDRSRLHPENPNSIRRVDTIDLRNSDLL